MRRNGRSGESGNKGSRPSSSSSSSSSSGYLSTIFSLAGGIGIGAGLLYLLDPDKGAKRRRQIASSAAELAASAKDYAGETLGGVGSAVGSALGSVREMASDKLSGIRGYAGDRADDVKAFAQKQVFGETRAEHRIGMTMCALSSMALGAAFMYAFDPSMGRSRRRYAREQAGNFASQASNYARQAGDAIRSGVGQARDKVSSMTSGYAAEQSQQPEPPSI